ARHLHDVVVAELLHELRHHFILVELFQTGRHCLLSWGSGGVFSDRLATRAEHAQPPSILEHLGTDALALAGGRVEQHHVRHVDRRLALDHATGLAGLGVGLGVALEDVDVRHDDLVAEHAHHVAGLALVPAGDHDDLIALLDSISHCPVLRSQHFGSERDDLHELLGTQLAGHGPEDARADRLVLVVEQHRGVAVEADQRTVGTTHALAGTHHDGVVDLALLHLAARDGILHRHLDDVADRGVTALGAAEHLDAHHFLGTGVVRHVEV